MSPPASSLSAKARALVQARSLGVLGTQLSSDRDQPFSSMMHYAPAADGSLLFLLSTLAVHTANLKAHERASLTVWSDEAERSLLESARLTLVGRALAVPSADLPSVRETYLKRHPQAEEYVDFGDFSFYRFHVESVYYIGGFGDMGWASGPEYGGRA